MCAKVGSSLWKVEIPKGIPEKTMLVGIDVYHKTTTKKNSIAAFVASVDN